MLRGSCDTSGGHVGVPIVCFVVFAASPLFGHVWPFPTPHMFSLRSPSRSPYITPFVLWHVLLYASIYGARPEGAEPHGFIPSHRPLGVSYIIHGFVPSHRPLVRLVLLSTQHYSRTSSAQAGKYDAIE